MEAERKPPYLCQQGVEHRAVGIRFRTGKREILLHPVKLGEPPAEHITGADRKGRVFLLQQTQKGRHALQVQPGEAPAQQVELSLCIAALTRFQTVGMGGGHGDEELDLLEEGAQSLEAVQHHERRFRPVRIDPALVTKALQLGQHGMQAFEIVQETAVDRPGRKGPPFLPRHTAPGRQPCRLDVEPGTHPPWKRVGVHAPIGP